VKDWHEYLANPENIVVSRLTDDAGKLFRRFREEDVIANAVSVIVGVGACRFCDEEWALVDFSTRGWSLVNLATRRRPLVDLATRGWCW